MAKIIVRELLKEKGISIKELAGLMGISSSAVSQLLANPYPSLQVLERIANAIGVDVVDFFAQDYSYLNGYVETGGQIYPVRSREQFVSLIDKVDGIVHIPSFVRQDDFKSAIRGFLTFSVHAGKTDGRIMRYGIKEVFALFYDAVSGRINLTLCIGDGHLKVHTFDTKDYKAGDTFTDTEKNVLLEAILAEIERIDEEEA
jgi:transcriptional regulator with XRE-family HTH domain